MASWRIRDVTLIGGGGGVRAGMTITGQNNLIEGVTESINAETQSQSNSFEFDIDGSGAFVSPGLVNAHEHLDMHRTPGTMHDRMAVHHDVLVLRAMRNAIWDLSVGVTAIRDLGSMDATNIRIRDAIDNGTFVGPTVVACGQMIAMTGGHGQPLCVEVDGTDEALKETRRQLKLGADVIKVCASGGVVAREREDPWLPEFSPQELQVIVDEAHLRGVKVAAHAQPPKAIDMAVKAGVDSIEHGAFMTAESAALLAEHNVTYVPTIGDTVRVVQVGHLLGRPDWMISAAGASLESRRLAVRNAISAGVRFATGSDVAGEIGVEMAELVDCGLSVDEAFDAATINGADLLGLGERYGQIEPGFEANLVVYASDPRVDLGELETTISHVVKGGRIFTPEGLKQSFGIKDVI